MFKADWGTKRYFNQFCEKVTVAEIQRMTWRTVAARSRAVRKLLQWSKLEMIVT